MNPAIKNQISKKVLTVIFAICIIFTGIDVFSQCIPVANFPFNGNVNDVSGYNNHGILGGQTSNPVLTTDRFGNPNSAYLFGGFYNKNWIQIPNSPTLNFGSRMSVSLWFKQCAFDGMDINGNYSANGRFVLFSKAGDGIAARPGFWGMTSTSSSNVLDVSFSNTNTNPFISLNFNDASKFDCFDTCEWIHSAFVIDSTEWKIYFNGKLSRQAAMSPADFTAANLEDFWIGRMFGSPVIWYPFNGVIDDVSIYNCALTQNEIDVLYNNYSDPLSFNNTIIIDSIDIVQPGCNGMPGAVSVYTNDITNQYSINSGLSFQPSNTFNNLDTGTYSITIKSFCTQTDTTITLTNSENFTSLSVAICNGAFYQLPGGVMTNVPGIYSDTLLNSSLCDSIIEIDLSVYPPIEFNVAVSPAHCNMDNGTATVSIINGIHPVQYQWSGGVSADSIATNLSPGNYFITLTDSAGCSVTDTVAVGQVPALMIDAEITDATCGENNGEIKISTQGGSPPLLYNWSPNVGASSFISNLSDGNYIVIVSDSAGCNSADTLTIGRIPDLEINIVSSDDTCNQSVGNAYVNILSGTAPYTFTWMQMSDTTQFVDQLTEGQYTVSVIDSPGCSAEASVQISNTGEFNIDLGNDTTICPGMSIKLSPGFFSNYRWQDNSDSTYYLVNYGGVYWVEVTDRRGCISSDTLIVVEGCFDDILFPNSFTPNGDGINDYFTAMGMNITDYHLRIFNRWGEMVFETSELTRGWNGFYKNRSSTSGIYAWIVKYRISDGEEKEKKGKVNLIR